MTPNTNTDHMLVKLGDDDLQLDELDEDIRGRIVVDRDGAPLGHVSNLFIDKSKRKVRMLEVAAGGFLGLGERHFLLPVAAIASVSSTEVHIDQTSEKVVGSPAYDPKLSMTPLPDSWRGYYDYYGFSPYGNSANQTLPGIT
jgi:sporulation protein YlmC with PRC-barrel domain